MLSIVIKDVREVLSKFKFALIFIIAFMSILRDSDLIFMITFAVIAPVFLMFLAHDGLAKERSSGTEKFLFSLPVKNSQIFAAKCIGSLISGFILYFLLGLIALFFGMQPWPNGFEVMSLKIYPSYLFFYTPITIWALGIMTSVLHPVVSGSIILLIPSTIMISALIKEPISELNPTLFTFFLILFSLISAKTLFNFFPEIQGKKWLKTSAIIVIASLIGISTILFVLNSISEMGNRSFNSISEMEWAFLPKSNQLLVSAERNSFFLDPVTNPKFDGRILKLIENASKTESIDSLNPFKFTHKANLGCRVIGQSVFNYDYSKFAFVTDLGYVFPGFPEILLQDMSTGKTLKTGLSGTPLGFLDNGNLVYKVMKRKNESGLLALNLGTSETDDEYTSVNVFDFGSNSSREVASFSSRCHFKEYTDKKVLVCRTGRSIELMRLDNFEVLKTPFKEIDKDLYVYLKNLSNSMLFSYQEYGSEDKKGEYVYYRMNQNFEFEKLPLKSDLTPMADTPDGKIIFLESNRVYEDGKYSGGSDMLHLYSPETGLKVLVKHFIIYNLSYDYSSVLPANSKIVSSNGSYFIYGYRNEKETRFFSVIDLQTGKEISQPDPVFSTIRPFKTDSFIVVLYGEKEAIYTLSPSNGFKPVKRFSIDQIFGKGVENNAKN